MHIVELMYPGTWLDDADANWCSDVARLLSEAESPLAEAAISLTWFELEQQNSRGPYVEQGAESVTDAGAFDQFLARLNDELGSGPYNSGDFLAFQFRLELEAKYDHWKRGAVPRDYAQRFVFIHAKTFLLALDRIERLLTALAAVPNVPQAVGHARAAFDLAVPDLRGVRNSVAHHEDRMRGLGPGGKPLTLMPVDNPLVRAPGGVLIVESLIGDRFGSTMADGEYGEVSVTPTTLAAANRVIQASVNAFRWKGPPHHWPR